MCDFEEYDNSDNCEAEFTSQSDDNSQSTTEERVVFDLYNDIAKRDIEIHRLKKQVEKLKLKTTPKFPLRTLAGFAIKDFPADAWTVEKFVDSIDIQEEDLMDFVRKGWEYFIGDLIRNKLSFIEFEKYPFYLVDYTKYIFYVHTEKDGWVKDKSPYNNYREDGELMVNELFGKIQNKLFDVYNKWEKEHLQVVNGQFYDTRETALKVLSNEISLNYFKYVDYEKLYSIFYEMCRI